MSLPEQLIECVANVSEGRDGGTLDLIADAIDSVPNCFLLHQDRGHGAHRTVFTFAGTPMAVMDAAYHIYKVSAERIDMRNHRGTHPRVGAVDVCPFVPIKGINVSEVVALTQVLGKRLGEDLNVPVYLYEASASAEHRRNLADVRRGEYEGLISKSRLPEWVPDFGPIYNERFGATVLGARRFLIAWNINLAPGVPLSTAKRLAARLRGSGSAGEPGLFPGLKAIGWYIEEFGYCQISCNVTDPDSTNLARIYLTAVNLAAALGAGVTGSELIGLVPQKYLRAVGKQFCFSGNQRDELRAAVSILGLDDRGEFDLEDRVLEMRLRNQLGDKNDLGFAE